MKYRYQLSISDGRNTERCGINFEASSDDEAKKIAEVLDLLLSTISQTEETDICAERIDLFRGEKIG